MGKYGEENAILCCCGIYIESKTMDKEEEETQVAIDAYAVLDLPRTATAEEIKRAYFQNVRRFPPEQEPEKFQQIRRAYELLRDPKQRSLTDLFLLQPPPDLPNRRRPNYDLSVHREDIVLLAIDMIATPMEEDFREI